MIDFSIVVLCADRKPKNLSATVRSVRNFVDCPCVAVVPKGTSQSIVEEMKPLCSTYRGGMTYTSLINDGLKKVKSDWAIILFAGVILRPNFWKKYTVFIDSDKDIIYHIDADHREFCNATLNGMMLHKDALKNIGPLPEIANLEEGKVVWAYNAIQCGYRLKGLLGVRLG